MKVCIIGCMAISVAQSPRHLSDKNIQVIGVCRSIPKDKTFKNFCKLIVGDIRDEKVHKNFIIKINSSNLYYFIESYESEKDLKYSIEVNLSPPNESCK